MNSRVRPWISKKVGEYMGEEEQSLIDFISQKVVAQVNPNGLITEIAMVNDVFLLFSCKICDYWASFCCLLTIFRCWTRMRRFLSWSCGGSWFMRRRWRNSPLLRANKTCLLFLLHFIHHSFAKCSLRFVLGIFPPSVFSSLLFWTGVVNK